MPKRNYTVWCRACGAIWQPGVRTPLWWKARQHSEKGFLDGLPVSGQECGCVKEIRDPDAPIRVFGYDDMCKDFDIPFCNFGDAVQKYRELDRAGGYEVFISGVSPKVEARLRAF